MSGLMKTVPCQGRLPCALVRRPMNSVGRPYVCFAKGTGGLEVPDFKLQEDYKTKIAKFYDERSGKYDDGDWHPRIAKKLIDGCSMQPGDRVLDLCAGTGISTFIAADAVGKEGRVVAVDVAKQMLERLREKTEEQGYSDFVDVVHGDAETVEFPRESFDWIVCSSAFIWMTDLVGALARWRTFLVPGGGIAFHSFTEEAFVQGVVLINAAAKHGVQLTFSQPTGTKARVENLLKLAGYCNSRVEYGEDGEWMALSDAKASFDGMASHSSPMTAPLIDVPEDKLKLIRADYDRELEERASDDGVWNDKSIFYTYAQNV